MLSPLFATLLLIAPAPACDAPAASVPAVSHPAAEPIAADSVLEAIYRGGQRFEDFLGAAKARREVWVKNWEQGTVPADALAKARALPGRWRIVVSVVDACSDSVNSIPYLARLVASVPSLELRLVTPGAARPFTEKHRTPDGRTATPTVVILDAAGQDVGCWVEKPAPLLKLAEELKAAGKGGEYFTEKMKWYEADAGATSVREIVEVLAAAAAGKPLCLGTTLPTP